MAAFIEHAQLGAAEAEVVPPRSRGRGRMSAPGPSGAAASGVAGVQERFGPYGGRFVPEVLMAALDELSAAWVEARDGRGLPRRARSAAARLRRPPDARSTSPSASPSASAARVYLKREDLAHTGAHKINNAVGQALLAQRMGKPRVIAETGAGQHGVATATACALLGLECVVYMGTEDMRRQAPNVERMRLLGAEVAAVEAGARTLKEAVSAAIRDWVTNVGDTHYIIGSAVGPGSVPGARARSPARDRRRGARAGARRRGRAARSGSSPASAAARTRSAPSTPSSTTRSS